MPRARATEQLVVEDLTDETLVYDLERHRAHCLNPAATLVWRACDGRTSVAEAAARLERELRLVGGKALVWNALDQLARAHLLEPGAVLPPARSRRALIRALGLGAAAAVLLPAVDSIVSPVAAQAASCVTSAECESLLPPACTGQPVCGPPGMCCEQRGRNCKAKKC
jgi:hypothetical protein